MQDYGINSEFVKAFDEEVKSVIDRGVEGFDDELFNRLALQEFLIQYHTVEYYKEFCEAQGVTPDKITRWEQIPALPSEAFKNTVIASFPVSETELTLMTSGTSNPNSPSKIYRDKRCVELYYLANKVVTKTFLFPDVETMKLLLMVPSPKLSPTMGMAVGLEQLRQNFGNDESMYLISPEGMEWEKLFDALRGSETTGIPVAIVGATSGLVYFYNFCRQQGLSFQLPNGSRICDGGGYYGTFGDCSREEYLHLCGEILGVSAEYCVNTLGSGESTTNYFDNVLKNHLQGKLGIARYKESPPWTRTIVIDPDTGQRVPKGERGLLRHYDLVNRANVLAVQTNNLGFETDEGFEIIGRVDVRNKAEGTRLNTMISGRPEVCSTVATEMLAEGSGVCSTVANEMLADDIISGKVNPCSTKTDKILVAASKLESNEELTGMSNQELLEISPHGNMFKYVTKERLEKLKQLCPYLKLKGVMGAAKATK